MVASKHIRRPSFGSRMSYRPAPDSYCCDLQPPIVASATGRFIGSKQ